MKRRQINLFITILFVLLLSLNGASFLPMLAPSVVSAQSGIPQVAWTAAMAEAEDAIASNFTCRMITRPSIGGNTIRIHLSNFFGSYPETFNAVTVALRTSRAAVSNVTAVNFGGQRLVTIPAHGQVTSDPIAFTVNAQQDLAVSLYYGGTNPTRTANPQSLTTSFCTDFGGGAGDHTNDTADSAFTNWGIVAWWVSAVDVYQNAPRGAVVAIGDSITAGLWSTIDGNNRWEDVLSTRFLNSSNPKSVVNEGIGSDSACPAANLPPGV